MGNLRGKLSRWRFRDRCVAFNFGILRACDGGLGCFRGGGGQGDGSLRGIVVLVSSGASHDISSGGCVQEGWLQAGCVQGRTMVVGVLLIVFGRSDRSLPFLPNINISMATIFVNPTIGLDEKVLFHFI